MTMLLIIALGCSALLLGKNRSQRKYNAWERSRKMFHPLKNN